MNTLLFSFLHTSVITSMNLLHFCSLVSLPIVLLD